MAKKRVLSGIRATGRLHLGNYLGAVEGMLALQDPSVSSGQVSEYETFYMVADAHTLTTPYEVEELRRNRREVIIDYLAAGLDPEKSILFLQSDVPQHFEMAFYFSSVMTVARMQHLPTFKEKVKQYPEHVTMALLNYPVLMAADILVYQASHVPVGIDQEPHLEVAREIARKMNDQFGMDFPEPRRFKTKGGYVPGLTAEGKMSKSVEGSYINLTDDLETIKQRLAGVPTNTGKGAIKPYDKDVSIYEGKLRYTDEVGRDSAGVATLFELVELFQGENRRKEYESQYDIKNSGEGVRYKELKEELAEAIYERLRPIQEKRRELESKPEYVDRVIAEGAEKARVVAGETVAEVKEKMGLG